MKTRFRTPALFVLVATVLATLAVVVTACGGDSGSAKVTVPDLSGKTASEANAALSDANLTAGDVTMDYSGDSPEGFVFRQTPEAGTEVEEGSAIGYIISKGEPPVPASAASPSPSASPTQAASQPSKLVKAMQQELKQAGYYTGPIDGIFGAATTAAIRAAQEAAGLTVDGVYGPRTHEAVVAQITGNTSDSASGSGFDSAHMRQLQRQLTLFGYYDGAIDGEYGPRTVAAVKALQKDYGLPVTGQIDQGTYTQLYLLASQNNE